MQPFSLEGKVAIVTGGSKGIGKAIALGFAEAGASVVLAARGQEALEQAAGEIEAVGAKVVQVPTDATDLDQTQNLVDRTLEAFGTIDILVNNAGSAPFLSTIDQIRLEGFEKYFRINFISALYCTKAVAPVLLAKQDGKFPRAAPVFEELRAAGLRIDAAVLEADLRLAGEL